MHHTTRDSSQSEGLETIPTDPGLLAKFLITSPVGITVMDAGGQITFANRKAEEILGLAKSEITGHIYNTPEWRITTFEGGPFPVEELPFQKVRDTGKAVENVRYAIVWPDGRIVCLSINASPLTNASGGFAGMVTSLEDITEAVETERAFLQRQNRAYKVISSCNETLIRAADETSLLREVCRIIVEDGGYRLSWVGYTEKGGGKIVKPVAQCGFEEGYLDAITITWDETDTGQGPTGTAIRTGQPARARNIASDPTYAPWREQALKRGYASSLALPLIANSHTLGALNIYAAEPDAFDAGEEGLLMQMANDLAYGITTLRGREELTRNLAELKESREDWRRIFNSISDPVMILDLDQNILTANPATEIKLGLPLDRIYGRKCYEVFHLIDEAAKDCPFKSLIESGGAVVTEEAVIESVNGTFLVTVSPIFDSEGKLFKVLEIAKDITERKKTENVLKESETRLNEAQRIAHIGSWELDIVNNVLTWSDEIYRMFEIDPKKFGSSYEAFLDAIHPEDREAVNFAYTNALKTRIPYAIDHRLLFPDGRIKYVHERCETFYDADGKHLRSVGTTQDITERKRTEDAIRDGEEKQRLLLQNIDEIVYMVETDEDPLKGDVTFVSGQVESITGYVPRDFMGDPAIWFGNIHPDDIQSVTDATMKLYEDKERVTRFYRLKHKVTGEYKWLEDRVVPKLDENGDITGFFGTVRDITERKQTEDELRLLQTIIMAVSEAEDLPSSIGVVLKEVCDTTGWIMGEAWMPSRDGTELECSPVWHAGIKGLDEFRQMSCQFTFPIGVGLPGRVWASREPEWIEDVSKDEKCFRSKYAERAGIKSGVAIPVLLHDKVIAVLDFFIREPRREDRKLINMVSGVAAQLGSVIARKQARDEVKQYNMLLNAISRALVKFINDADLTAVFDDLLYRILLLTNSQFGLIGEVRNNADGQPYLCTHATACITADQQAENFFKKQGPHFEFHNMDMLLGDAITKGEPVIVNDVPGSPRRGKLPEGHPEITSFLGLPFKSGDRVVGLVGIANRQDGYDEEIVSYLEPLLITCTSIVEAYRNDQLRLQTEKELVKSYKTLRNTFDGVVSTLASTTESRDPYTAGHQERVSRLAAAIAQELGLSKDQIKGIRMAGLLHDLGKMSVPVEILSKPGKINEHELNIIRMHTTVGNDILSSIEFPWPVATIAHQHHERIDGSGYPLGLKGDEISLEACILAVADVVEAMSSHRPYRAAKGIDAALNEIAQQSGILYDPNVADACLRLFREKGYELD